ACANSFTAAAPIPREPPVIKAAFPAKEIMIPPSEVKAFAGTALRALSCPPGPSAPCCLELGLARRADKVGKQFLRKRIVRQSLRMPLNANPPVFRRIEFHGFHNSVRAACRYLQSFSRLRDRLVVAAIDPHQPGFGQPAELTARR